MDEQGQHGHPKKLLGLPPAVWIGAGGLLLLFVLAHRGSTNSTVSGVTLPDTTQTDLNNLQVQAGQLQLQQQQEALASKTASDLFNLKSQNQAFTDQQATFNSQQASQQQADALAFQGAQQQLQFSQQNQQLGVTAAEQQLSQSAGQYAEQQALEQAQYRNMHQGGFTLGTFVNGVTQLASSAVNVFKAVTTPTAGGAAKAPPTTPPFVTPAGIPPQ